MKLILETGKVRWSGIWRAVVLLAVGAALGGLGVLMAPTTVYCRFTLPDSFQIPSAS